MLAEVQLWSCWFVCSNALDFLNGKKHSCVRGGGGWEQGDGSSYLEKRVHVDELVEVKPHWIKIFHPLKSECHRNNKKKGLGEASFLCSKPDMQKRVSFL